MKGGRDPTLHVDAATTPDDLSAFSPLEASGDVVGAQGYGNRVEVAGDDDPLRAAQVGTGDDGVAMAQDLQVRQPAQGLLDCVCQWGLGPGDAAGIHQGQGQLGRAHDIRPRQWGQGDGGGLA